MFFPKESTCVFFLSIKVTIAAVWLDSTTVSCISRGRAPLFVPSAQSRPSDVGAILDHWFKKTLLTGRNFIVQHFLFSFRLWQLHYAFEQNYKLDVKEKKLHCAHAPDFIRFILTERHKWEPGHKWDPPQLTHLFLLQEDVSKCCTCCWKSTAVISGQVLLAALDPGFYCLCSSDMDSEIVAAAQFAHFSQLFIYLFIILFFVCVPLCSKNVPFYCHCACLAMMHHITTSSFEAHEIVHSVSNTGPRAQM